MSSLPKNKSEILVVFRRYDFRDALGHPLENCAEFKEPTLKELYENQDEIDNALPNDTLILTSEKLMEMFDRVG